MAINNHENDDMLYSYEDVLVPVPKSFSWFVKVKRERLTTEEGDPFSTRMLADSLGLDYEMFRKIVNMQKPTKKRDCIIAICALLYATPEETNAALECYNGMPKLNKNYTDDEIIINMLKSNYNRCVSCDEYELMTIDEINEYLDSHHVPKLIIIEHRSSQTPFKPNYPYPVLKKRVECGKDELALGDQYDSLASRYSPLRYSVYASMTLGNAKDPRYILTATQDGKLELQDLSLMADENADWFRSFRSLDDTGMFRDCYTELQKMVKDEHAKMLGILNDTKNYSCRISSRIIDGKLHVFLETYNYKVPELNEYYLMDYSGGVYTLYVLDSSQFMRYYLSADEYIRYYGRSSFFPKESFPSIESIQSKMDTAPTNRREIFRVHKSAYVEMVQKIDSLIADLKIGTAHICKVDALFDSPYDAIMFYDVADKFNCTIDDEYGVINGIGSDTALFEAENGDQIELTIDDIMAGCALGLMTINEIIAFRLTHDSFQIVDLL